MKFIKLLWFDIRNGLVRNKFLIVASVMIPVVFCLDFFRGTSFYVTKTGITRTLGDLLLFFFGGMKEYIPSLTEKFIFPIRWLIIMLAIFFSTLNYPYDDMQSFGQQILIRSKSRNLWWISKCVWVVLTTLFFSIVTGIIIILFSYFSGSELSLILNTGLVELIYQVKPEAFRNDVLALGFSSIISLTLLVLAVSISQITISLFIKPLFSFIAISVIMLISAYLFNPIAIGNFAMLLRNDNILENGINPCHGIIVSLFLILVLSIIGLIKFHSYDIINRD